MPTYSYTRTVRPAKLLNEIVAAIPLAATATLVATAPLQGETIASFTVRVAEGVTAAAVAAVVAAHDPATPSATEQQATQETSDLAALRTQYTQDMADIDADLAASGSARGLLNTNSWDTLTAAQRTAGMKGLLDREQAKLAREKRLLKVVAVLVRRQV